MKHTPGPWVVENENVKTKTQIWTDMAVRVDSGMHRMICEIPRRKTGNDHENALLISASPDLLNACQYALERFLSPNMIHPETIEDVCVVIIAAINKATGK